jgi:short-subunit dehydrogenase
VRSLSLSLHEELKSHGIHVTVLLPSFIEAPVSEKLGFDPATMPMKPMTVDRCVYEGLRALTQNRPVIIPGQVNRIMMGGMLDGQDPGERSDPAARAHNDSG